MNNYKHVRFHNRKRLVDKTYFLRIHLYSESYKNLCRKALRNIYQIYIKIYLKNVGEIVPQLCHIFFV